MGNIVDKFHLAVASKGLMVEKAGSLGFSEAGNYRLDGGGRHGRGGHGFDSKKLVKVFCLTPLLRNYCSDTSKLSVLVLGNLLFVNT